MSNKPQSCTAEPTRSKSLYTAVLYDDVPESCISSSTTEVGPCSSYLKRITREHLARASMEEVESSVDDSLDSGSKERITRLTEKVRRAYSEAHGNPADGRWSFVAGLLQLGSTRGKRHWLGVNTLARAPEIPQHLSILLPNTSEEWHELERKWKEEEHVKHKVQRWIVDAKEFEPLTPETTILQESIEDKELLPFMSHGNDAYRKSSSQATLKHISTLVDPLVGRSKLGFSVVKTSNTLAGGKPKPKTPRTPSSSLHPASTPVSPPDHKNGTVLDRNPNISQQQEQKPSIDHSDVLINDFLPPSFSLSQVQTSTPLPLRANRAKKPTPIPLVESLSLPSPVPSPKPTKAHGKFRNVFTSSESLDLEPSSSWPKGNVTDVTRKRSRSPSSAGGPATKRVRLLVDEDAGLNHLSLRLSLQPPLSRELASFPPDTTPQKSLPQLKELLASAKRSKGEVWSKKRFKAHMEHPASPETPSSSWDAASPKKVAAAVSEHPPEITCHNSNLEPTHFSGSYTELAGAGAGVTALCNERNLTPHGAESDSPPPIKSNGSAADEPSAHELTPHSCIVLGSALQTALEPESQPDVAIDKVLAYNEFQPSSPTPLPSSDSNLFRHPSADLGSLSPTHGVTTYDLYGLDVFDNPSPTKSLSSLADADSESDSDSGNVEQTGMDPTNPLHLMDSEFRPQLTSTQKPGTGSGAELSVAVFGSPLPSDSLVWGNEKLVSTSQLQAEVNSQVDELDKFMEADLGYDLVVPGL